MSAQDKALVIVLALVIGLGLLLTILYELD